MIMGSDYGHQDQSKEDGLVALMRGREDLRAEVVEKILGDNARRFYGLSSRSGAAAWGAPTRVGTGRPRSS